MCGLRPGSETAVSIPVGVLAWSCCVCQAWAGETQGNHALQPRVSVDVCFTLKDAACPIQYFSGVARAGNCYTQTSAVPCADPCLCWLSRGAKRISSANGRLLPPSALFHHPTRGPSTKTGARHTYGCASAMLWQGGPKVSKPRRRGTSCAAWSSQAHLIPRGRDGTLPAACSWTISLEVPTAKPHDDQ